MFKFKEVKKNIFCLEFQEEYDMCMMFLRYQEFYESPSSRFRGKSFKILDFMKWYSLEFGNGSFTYPIDWAGFNFYGDVIREVNSLGIPDRNDYDREMAKVYKKCKKRAEGDKFYIIGVHEDGGALSHEIAHGFFYINSEYKKEMVRLVKQMTPECREALEEYLTKVGYTPQVFVDEIQANMATTKDWSKYSPRYVFKPEVAEKLNETQKDFAEVFNRYFNE